MDGSLSHASLPIQVWIYFNCDARATIIKREPPLESGDVLELSNLCQFSLYKLELTSPFLPTAWREENN